MIVYLSGAVTSRLETYKRDFERAEVFCKEQGYTVLNPSVLPKDLKPESYMPICFAMIDASDAIFMIKGWEKSHGATLEKAYAGYQNKMVIMET